VRKLSQREKALLGAATLAGLALAGWSLRPSDGAPAVPGRPQGERALPAVPRIDLARMDAPRAEDSAGRRDLFAFGRAAEPEADAAPPPVAVVPHVAPVAEAAAGMPGSGSPVTPSLPPLKLWFIGSVENKAGVKVAVLVTDRKEVLTGQSGQVVANRYRIARIGLESVDLEDVASGQSRRVPLKGN
jgi:hypothetical protein